ncbi:MAG: DUF1972 domain-containing protein [Tannerella sp.]|jgi:glycosyltransferase involved in cell wall biosynthesis|nr:DUF1972 domain-containing protein [Tannerella sp.]
MKKVAIIGIQGVPANYGGFETLAENLIGKNGSPEISYTVFCSSKDVAEKRNTYKGAVLKYISLRANGIQSILYDIISLCRSICGYDVILILGTSGCLFLPVFRLFCRKKVIVNIDGIEHQREKWGKFARWFLRISEVTAVKFADIIITDNEGIQDYVRGSYGKEAELIAYGGDHVLRMVNEKQEKEILNKYNITSGQYAISVCRIEPENNCHITLDAFTQAGEHLVFIGNWNQNNYGKELQKKYSAFAHIIMLDPIYDLDILYVLRKHSLYYIHGHSAGGTNPSLVEAMFCGCNVFAYDCRYNRYTTGNKAHYFHNAEDLASKISANEGDNSQTMVRIARQRYLWGVIARQYESLY